MPDNPLVGVWKLVSCDAMRTNGTRVPIYGKQPVGRLYYDDAGNMSVHIMKAGRPRCAGETKFGASDEEMKSAFEGYEAYCSTYVINPEQQTIRHVVVASLFPNWTGTIQDRFYGFDADNRLVLSSAPIGSKPAGNTIVQLVWERMV